MLKLRHPVLFFSLLLLAACASNQGLDLESLQQAEITNFRAPQGSVLSSGQPSQQQLEVMAASGVKHVVNLRTASEEVDFNEQAAVQALGMRYYSIPVSGVDGINTENAARLQSILAEVEGQPVLVHCATGNRVGGLMAVNHFRNGADLDAAISEGARWGMTSERLQGAVRESLEND
jgi:uncharacterized protein (TIGR01244 family)